MPFYLDFGFPVRYNTKHNINFPYEGVVSAAFAV